MENALALMNAPPDDITLDFQNDAACSGGKLADIRRMFSDPRTPLTNGADRLTICDDQELQTVRANLPWAIANRYKGCVKWRSGELIMLRTSKAVCARPRDGGYVCDGRVGRESLGASGIAYDKAVENARRSS